MTHRSLCAQTLALLLATLTVAGCSSEDTTAPEPKDGLLDPPAAGEGVQYQMVTTLEPGQEVERCKLFTVPPEGMFVQREKVQFSPGSHHVLLYKTPYTEMPTETVDGVPIDPTEVHDCDGASSLWELNGVVGGSQSWQGDSFLGELPEGVALKVEPGTVLVMNTHYLNASSDPIEAEARINLYTIPPEEVHTEAGVLFHYNPFIRVPANGTASARMRCPIAKDISVVSLQSHMHRRGVNFVANLTDAEGQLLQELYTNTQWSEVPVEKFAPPLQIKAGQALDYRCDYENPEARDVVQGITTRDEMCMLIGPYFPKDPGIEECTDEQGYPAEIWIGSGAATCAETLQCLSNSSPIEQDQGASLFGCMVDSCPGAAVETSNMLRCQMTGGHGACLDQCTTDAEACAACVATACEPDLNACLAAACE